MKGCIQLLNAKFASLVIIHVSNNNFFLEFFFEYPYYLPGPVVYPYYFSDRNIEIFGEHFVERAVN